MSLENEVEDMSKWGIVDTWGEPIIPYHGLKVRGYYWRETETFFKNVGPEEVCAKMR